MSDAVATRKDNLDLWIGPNDNVALEGGPQNVEDALSSIDDQGLHPTIVSNLGERASEEVSAVAEVAEQIGPPAVVEETETEPQVYSYPDGSSVTIEKTKKGWEATLDSGTGAQAEVFKGATKDEMFARLAVGKINATKKIRELSRQPLLGDETERPQARPVAEEAPKPKRLSADEIFDIKAKLEQDPDLALEAWFQKRTGMTPEELVTLTKNATTKATEAQESTEDQAATQILREWLDITDDYVHDDRNRDAIFAWLLKYKARQNPKKYDLAGAVAYLFQHGHLTVENLDLAWDDLKSDGQAVLATVPEPEPEPVKPAVRTRTRPAAGLGIRSSETSAVRPPTTVDDTNVDVKALTLQESEKLMNDLRRFKIDHPDEYARLKAIGDAKKGRAQV